jgi:hypothetical protein
MTSRLAPADLELVAKIALQGPAGQALEHTLDDIVQESLVSNLEQEEEEGKTRDTDEEKKTEQESNTVMIDPEMADNILHSFGRAVAETKWEIAPAALLRGRVDHYNRVGGQWRIVVEEAEVRPRVLLDSNRKRRDRTSLWEVSERRLGKRRLRLNGTLQILAYDDL